MRWKIPGYTNLVYKSDQKYRLNWDKKAGSKGAQVVQDFFQLVRKNDVWFAEYCIPKTRLRIDYLNTTLKFAVEFNGRQHNNFVQHFHKNRAGFLGSLNRDIKKAEILELNNFKLIEIFDEDLPFLNRKFFEKFDIYL